MGVTPGVALTATTDASLYLEFHVPHQSSINPQKLASARRSIRKADSPNDSIAFLFLCARDSHRLRAIVNAVFAILIGCPRFGSSLRSGQCACRKQLLHRYLCMAN